MKSEASRLVAKLIDSRISTRQFLKDRPVPRELVLDILRVASRAPSGGNLQPWEVYMLDGLSRDLLVSFLCQRYFHSKESELGSILCNDDDLSKQQILSVLSDESIAKSKVPRMKPEYRVFPAGIKSDPQLRVFQQRRIQVAKQMYGKLGIQRKDKEGAFRHYRRNYQLFDAPTFLIFTIDQRMQQGQFVDLGLFMGNILTLCSANGLSTCAQESWAEMAPILHVLFDIPESQLIFCGLCIGYDDPTAPVNSLRTDRRPVEEFTRCVTFSNLKSRILSKL